MSYVLLIATLYQPDIQIRMSYADPERGGYGKPIHHLPTSEAPFRETPLKWRFAGRPMVARLEYWYGPLLPSMKYENSSKIKI